LRRVLALALLETSFGDRLAESLDDPADLAGEDAQGALPNKGLGLGAALRVEDIGGGPQLLEHVEQIEHERHVVEGGTDPLLEGSLAVGDDHPGVVALPIAPDHLGADVGDEGVLAGA